MKTNFITSGSIPSIIPDRLDIHMMPGFISLLKTCELKTSVFAETKDVIMPNLFAVVNGYYLYSKEELQNDNRINELIDYSKHFILIRID